MKSRGSFCARALWVEIHDGLAVIKKRAGEGG